MGQIQSRMARKVSSQLTRYSRDGNALEVLIVLWDLGKQLAEGRSVSYIESEKPLVLICCQHHDGGRPLRVTS